SAAEATMYASPILSNPTVRMAPRRRAPIDGGGSVLVVDDDPEVAQLLGRILEAEGYRVVSAQTSAEAIEHAMSGSFDAVISDLNLPGASGIDVLNVVRAYDPDVPLVLLTGAPTASSAIEAVRMGVLEYLVKPARPAELVSALDRARAARRAAIARREAAPLQVSPTVPASPVSSVAPRLTASFERAMSSLFVELQPVADAKRRTVVAYEARLGSREETLATEASLVVAAES